MAGQSAPIPPVVAPIFEGLGILPEHRVAPPVDLADLRIKEGPGRPRGRGTAVFLWVIFLPAAFAVVSLGGVTVAVGSYAFPVALGLTVGLAAIVTAAGVGVVGGLPAGVRASRRPIVESLRSVD